MAQWRQQGLTLCEAQCQLERSRCFREPYVNNDWSERLYTTAFFLVSKGVFGNPPASRNFFDLASWCDSCFLAGARNVRRCSAVWLGCQPIIAGQPAGWWSFSLFLVFGPAKEVGAYRRLQLQLDDEEEELHIGADPEQNQPGVIL